MEDFAWVDVATIIVDRENRQRTELKDIESLAASIRNIGQINPITVDREYKLIAGERRLTAIKSLGFDKVKVQFWDDLDESTAQIIELEENVKRADLDWRDLVASVAKYHRIKLAENPDWSQEDTADALSMSRPNVQRYLMVQGFVESGSEEVKTAPKLSQAVNFAQRAQERRKASAMRDLFSPEAPKAEGGNLAAASGENSPTTALSPVAGVITHNDVIRAVSGEKSGGIGAEKPTTTRAEIINANFIKWSETIQDQPFNLIHCDFPYGVNAGDTKGQSGAAAYGHYDDKPDVYWELIDAFIRNQDRFCSPSAHMVFWYSLDFHEQTIELFREAGWVVNPFPLIWFKSDNTGILPDANRGPRRVYETALFMTRGDRKIVRAVGNCVGCGVKKERHVSEKPKKMLEHFLRMLVDDTTRFVDPTCGSGNSVVVSNSLGAQYSLGLELNPEFTERAQENLTLST